MTRTVLLTLGRLPKALDIARGFARAGWRVVVAEPFARHLTGISNVVARSHVVTAPAVDRARYLAELVDVVRREAVELVVPVSEETMHVAFLRPLLPPGVRLHAMPAGLLLELHDKERFIGFAKGLDLAVPETHLLGTDAARDLAGREDVVIKPVLSCSGRGLRMLSRGTTLPEPGPEPQIVQRRVHGPVISSFSIATSGRLVSTVVYRAAVLSGSVAVCFERVSGLLTVEAWIERFVAATGYSGFVSFDFIIDASGRAWAIECNPRATSGIHFIDPDDLAAAIDAPDPAHPPRYRPQRLMQQFFPCLTETQAAFGDWPRYRHNLRCLLAAKDVTFSLRDPLPLLTMPWTAWNIISMARRKGTTFGEVATLDVGWYAADAAAEQAQVPERDRQEIRPAATREDGSSPSPAARSSVERNPHRAPPGDP